MHERSQFVAIITFDIDLFKPILGRHLNLSGKDVLWSILVQWHSNPKNNEAPRDLHI
jgi:hypothetical protein